MGLVYWISNFFINKTSQRKKSFFSKISFCLNFLHVLTILWAFCLVTSPKFFQIWDLLGLSIHLTPCLLSLTKIENWPNIRKWNAKAIKHKCGRPNQSKYKILFHIRSPPQAFFRRILAPEKWKWTFQTLTYSSITSVWRTILVHLSTKIMRLFLHRKYVRLFAKK